MHSITEPGWLSTQTSAVTCCCKALGAGQTALKKSSHFLGFLISTKSYSSEPTSDKTTCNCDAKLGV